MVLQIRSEAVMIVEKTPQSAMAIGSEASSDSGGGGGGGRYPNISQYSDDLGTEIGVLTQRRCVRKSVPSEM